LNTVNFLMWIYYVYKKDDCLRLIISECYSSELALTVGIDASVDNIRTAKKYGGKAREVNTSSKEGWYIQ
jgi:hypothetical protein